VDVTKLIKAVDGESTMHRFNFRCFTTSIYLLFKYWYMQEPC